MFKGWRNTVRPKRALELERGSGKQIRQKTERNNKGMNNVSGLGTVYPHGG